MNMKRTTIFFLAAFIAIMGGCTPETTLKPDNGTEQPENPGGEDKPGGSEEEPDKPENPDNPDKPGENPDTPGGEEEKPVNVIVVDPGEKYVETKPTPQHPELKHEVEYHEFFNPLQDDLDEFGNVDYVCAQGHGTDWPYITNDYFIRFYQSRSASKNGGYIRVRAHNGAKILSVTMGSATPTKIAHSFDGKMKKSETTEVKAGGTYIVENECNEICFYCMGTTQSERWELNSIKVNYKGGFTGDDFYVEPKEYGPLVRVELPLSEGFESGFPTTDKPTYEKYGLTAGRDNLQWSTWYGSFSWQNPISDKQSAQLRIYQEDEDYYENTTFGHLKMEYFIENLSKVSFNYWFSEFWTKATISWCEFGSSEWHNPQQIALEKYADRETIQSFTYELGKKANAKIRIEIDPDSGHPGKGQGHYDLIFDDFVFE